MTQSLTIFDTPESLKSPAVLIPGLHNSQLGKLATILQKSGSHKESECSCNWCNEAQGTSYWCSWGDKKIQRSWLSEEKPSYWQSKRNNPTGIKLLWMEMRIEIIGKNIKELGPTVIDVLKCVDWQRFCKVLLMDTCHKKVALHILLHVGQFIRQSTTHSTR